VIDALRYEVVRIRTIRSTWWLTGLAFVIGVLICTLMGWAFHHEFSQNPVSNDDIDGLGSILVTQLGASGEVPGIVPFLMAMIGIFAWGHEYRHGMIRASLTALNSRGDLWVAKYVVGAVWAVVVSFVTMLVCGLVATVFLHEWVTVLDGQTWGTIGRSLVYTVLLTWLGMAFTSVTRSQAFALVTLFLWPLLIESLISLIFLLVPGLRDHSAVTRFLPFDAGSQLTDVLNPGDELFGNPLSPLGGGIVFGLTAAVLMIASYLLFQRRDA
jgi:ABC-2 type transport system permease protein